MLVERAAVVRGRGLVVDTGTSMARCTRDTIAAGAALAAQGACVGQDSAGHWGQ
jgi:hypothetical protein